MNFISSIAWVPRGKAKALPDQVRLKPNELKELFEGGRSADDEGAEDTSDIEDKEDNESVEADNEEWADEEETKSDGDLDDDAEEAEEPPADKASGFSVSSLAVFSTNDDDPYVQVKDAEDVDSEDEDFKILPRDNLLAVAHVDEDANILEIYVYNEDGDDLYVHHDMILPSYPLALEWLPYVPGGSEDAGGNLLAVGSMKSSIQIWDLDLVNAMEPLFELKGTTKKRKRDQDSKMVSGHSDAVLGLSWNPLAEHVLASGSADQTVILWDLDQGKPATTLRGFTDKVQAVKWRPGFADQILCGSCDKTVRLFDCRYKKAQETVWNLEGEVERILWSNADSQYFYVATEDGQLCAFDIRKTDEALAVVQAHGKTITGLVTSAHIPGLLVTTSEDKRIKVWDLQATHVPELVFERKLKMGEIQFAAMSPDSPFVIALGGEDSDCNFRILDLHKISEEVRKRFDSRIPEEQKKREDASEEVKKEKKPDGSSSSQSQKNRNEKATAHDRNQIPDSNSQGKTTTKAQRNRPKVKHAKRHAEAEAAARAKEQPSADQEAVPIAKAPRFRPKNEHGKRLGWSGFDKRRPGGGPSQQEQPTPETARGSFKEEEKKSKIGKSSKK